MKKSNPYGARAPVVHRPQEWANGCGCQTFGTCKGSQIKLKQLIDSGIELLNNR